MHVVHAEWPHQLVHTSGRCWNLGPALQPNLKGASEREKSSLKNTKQNRPDFRGGWDMHRKKYEKKKYKILKMNPIIIRKLT